MDNLRCSLLTLITRRACVVVVFAAIALTALLPALALADGDPASDVLLGQDTYYPYAPAVTAKLAGQLDAMAAAARKAGYPVKVAIIGHPVDLGVIPDLFDKPQKYADFLVQEISFQGRQHLLVVMPAGYGVQGVSAAAAAAVSATAKPVGGSSDDLARAAEQALVSLTRAAGHPVQIGSGTSGGSGSSTAIIVIALVVVALLAIGGVLALRRRQAPA